MRFIKTIPILLVEYSELLYFFFFFFLLRYYGCPASVVLKVCRNRTSLFVFKSVQTENRNISNLANKTFSMVKTNR